MSIGYACLNIGTPGTNQRSVTMKFATPEKLTEVTAHNLAALDRMIDYNIENNIKLFRISSDLIPFGSSPVNSLDWRSIHAHEFSQLATKIKASGMRISMHPGQYTVLNSPREDVVERAIEDLIYHDKVLTALEADRTNKIILHVGGVYGDKEVAMARFAHNFERLPQSVKNRLIIENDERSYTIEEVLTLAHKLRIPAVFDNLHHAINLPKTTKTEAEWISEVAKTWLQEDGKQKIHYSQQDPTKQPGAHTQTIKLETFLAFFHQLPDPTISIMLEVKDKNLSAVKCINALRDEPHIKHLEKEWGKYKYAILEKSPAIYQEIRTLLKDKSGYPVREFYYLIETALADTTLNPGYITNTAAHVWGYFKEQAMPAERRQYERNLAKDSPAALKRHLLKLATKYEVDYLLQSLYLYL